LFEELLKEQLKGLRHREFMGKNSCKSLLHFLNENRRASIKFIREQHVDIARKDPLLHGGNLGGTMGRKMCTHFISFKIKAFQENCRERDSELQGNN